MAPTRQQILAAVVPINTFRLSVADIGWVEHNLNLPPEEFARGLLARRFTASRTRFRSRLKLAAGCIDIIKSNACPFSTNELDTRERERFLARSRRDPRLILEEFRTLWRGYRDTVLDAVDPGVARYKTEVETLLRAAQTETDFLISKTRARTGKWRSLQRNRAELANISTQVAEAFRNEREVRRAKMQFPTRHRRYRSIHSFLGVGDDDFLLYKSHIKRCDPKLITFPLRHLGWLSLPAFLKLQRQWQRNTSRDHILEQLAPEIDEAFFDNLLQIYDKIKEFLPVDRSSHLAELKRAWKADCMLGVALIGITQAEGLIWDFAARLRSKGFRIYKTVTGRHYPYVWDFDSRTFKYRYPSGHAQDERARLGRKKSQPLASARQLLEKTKLGSFMDEMVFSYLVDEFYDDRNRLAHGDVAKRSLRADAVGAILCQRTVLEQLMAFLVSSEGIA